VVLSTQIKRRTTGENDMVDLTQAGSEAVVESGIQNGLVLFCVVGSTAAITTIELEAGLVEDMAKILERIAPKHARYKHEERWHDDNGHSHVRASLIGPSVTVPVMGGRLVLGTWQQIVLVECDTRPRERIVTVVVTGE
jgi:secondary thiamine-phosphate synthase enzyme